MELTASVAEMRNHLEKQQIIRKKTVPCMNCIVNWDPLAVKRHNCTNFYPGINISKCRACLKLRMNSLELSILGIVVVHSIHDHMTFSLSFWLWILRFFPVYKSLPCWNGHLGLCIQL